MNDITETEAALLMLELKLEVMEIGLRTVTKILDECSESVDKLEATIKELYGSNN